MALSFTLTTLDGLDDSVKSLYKQDNGVFVLDVEGAESAESVQGLKNALQAQKDTNSELKRKETDALKAANEAEQARLREAGKHEELAANLADELNGIKAEREQDRQAKLTADKKAKSLELASKVGKDANSIELLSQLFNLDMSYSEAGILQGQNGETLEQMLDRVNKGGKYDSLIKGSQASGADLNNAGGGGRKSLSDMSEGERIKFKADDPDGFNAAMKGK